MLRQCKEKEAGLADSGRGEGTGFVASEWDQPAGRQTAWRGVERTTFQTFRGGR